MYPLHAFAADRPLQYWHAIHTICDCLKDAKFQAIQMLDLNFYLGQLQSISTTRKQ